MHTLQVTGASRDQFLCLAPATAAGFSVRTACSCGHCCHLRPTVPPSRATAPSSWASAPPSSARTAAPRGFLAKLDDHLIDLTIRTISVESGGCLRSLLFRPARSPCIFLSEAPTLKRDVTGALEFGMHAVLLGGDASTTPESSSSSPFTGRQINEPGTQSPLIRQP